MQRNYKIVLEKEIIDMKAITNETNQNEKKSEKWKCKLKNDVIKS